MNDIVAVIYRDHDPDADYHDWVFLPGYKGEPVTLKRDSRGRAHKHAWRDWVLLICNNTECPGQCLVNTSVIEKTAVEALPLPPMKGLPQ